MRELIEGVTRIRSIDGAGYGSANIYGKGILTYVGVSEDQHHTWVDTEGNVHYWGIGYGLGRYWEFVDDEPPKLKVGDHVGIKSLAYVGVVEGVDDSEYSISVRWEDGTLGCYDEKDLIKINSVKPLEDIKVMYETLGAKVKSTGSSSDYYKIVLPEWLLLKQKDNGFIMLEDLAEIMFDNDFNYVNVMKAQKRMFDLESGRGKEGNTFEYDATKCKYYIDKQVEVFSREQEDK